MQKNSPRVFAYTTTSLMLGSMYYLATHGFYRYVEFLDINGIIAWLAFGFTIGNLSYLLSKRFQRKSTIDNTIFEYLIGLLLIAPILIQILLREEAGVYDMKPFFFLYLIICTTIGSFFGTKSGTKQKFNDYKGQSA